MALRVAGLAHCNLVLVSSIYPPGCKIIPKEDGLKLLRPAKSYLPCTIGRNTRRTNRLIAASVGACDSGGLYDARLPFRAPFLRGNG